MSLKVTCRDRQLHDNVTIVTTEEYPLDYTHNMPVALSVYLDHSVMKDEHNQHVSSYYLCRATS